MENQRKVAIVTGAAGSIGAAICTELAEKDYQVVGLDIDQEKLNQVINQLNGSHSAFKCDLADEIEIAETIEKIGSKYARIDLIVNNAAIGPSMNSVADTTAFEFEKTFDINWVGPLSIVQKALKWMSKDQSSIINIASMAGVRSNPKRNAYSASKAAVMSMTRSLACELAGTNIRVNAIAPGYIRTGMISDLEKDNKLNLKSTRQRIPMGRLGRPDEIAKVASFLASEKAEYITGAIVTVDGGSATYNQVGDAHPEVDGIPNAELTRPLSEKKSKVVVITGALGGIGRATAELFDAQGDQLVILDYDQKTIDAVKHEFDPRHLILQVDITDEKQVKAAFETIKAKFKHIDVMINNAAVADIYAPVEKQAVSSIKNIFATNITGAFSCAREAVNLMPESGGVVINLGSINSHLPFAPRHAYGASKAAIEVITRCMAAELAPKGIRVVTICPGYIRTPGVAHLDRNKFIDTAKINRRIPLGKMGQPKYIANAAIFLASDDASYINGSALYVDGGWTAFGNAGDASGQEVQGI